MAGRKSDVAKFFATIYEKIGFESWCSPTGLNQHLIGVDASKGLGFDNPSLYTVIGLTTIAIVIIGYILFYYLPKSSAVFNLTKHWFITLLFIGIIGFVLAWGMSFNDLKQRHYWNVNKPSSEGKYIDKKGTEVDKTEAFAFQYTSGGPSKAFIRFKGSDCIQFGFANALFAMFLFGGISFIKPLRAQSNQSRNVPF